MSSLTTLVKAKAQLAALKLAVTVLPAPRPIVLMGPDSALQLCGTIAHTGAKRVLVVTDAVLFKLGVIDPISGRLKDHGVQAKARGIFGSPSFITADGELFWGQDRLDFFGRDAGVALVAHDRSAGKALGDRVCVLAFVGVEVPGDGRGKLMSHDSSFLVGGAPVQGPFPFKSVSRAADEFK